MAMMIRAGLPPSAPTPIFPRAARNGKRHHGDRGPPWTDNNATDDITTVMLIQSG
jgi:hypothetical protein